MKINLEKKNDYIFKNDIIHSIIILNSKYIRAKKFILKI